MNKTLLLLLMLSTIARADQPAPASIANATTGEALSAGLHAPDALTRATAARVAMLRNVAELLPQIRETLASEHDATAAREEIRALALLGGDADVAAAAAQSGKWPASMDDALADMIARRGADALDLYHSALATSRMTTHSAFFRQFLWTHSALLTVTSSRILGWHDAKGWDGLLRAAFDSGAAMPAGPMTASLGVPDDAIRFASIWYLVRGYATDPASIKDPLRSALLEPRTEAGSDREDFGRELLRRMLGGERKDDDRWLKFLATDEADRLLQNESESVLQYFTDAEYRTRHNRCAIQSAECRLPAMKPGPRPLPSQPVAEPAFILPSLLPAGLVDAVMTDARCRDEWIGVADATVDAAGRVTKLNLDHVTTSSSCRKAIDTILHLSLATPTSLRSPRTGPVLLAKARGASLCLDEHDGTRLVHVGGEVKAPIVKTRVEPNFPASARSAMHGGRSVMVIVEAVISRDGCVRNMRLLAQSQFPELNGAAVLAVSQWKFVPGYLDGQPVDVIFNLTINFRTD